MTDNRRARRGGCPAGIAPNALDGDAGIPVAMAYVKDQCFGRLFDPQKALAVGTAFPDLYKPFLGSRYMNNNCRRALL